MPGRLRAQGPDADGDSVIAARGGEGGKGNTHFKSATNRAPREATPGGEGERRELLLELKVIADVGLDRQAERRQEHAALAADASPAADRRLSVHHQASEPGHCHGRWRPAVRDGRYSGADRRGARRGRAWGTSFCGTSSGPASWCTWSSRCPWMAAIRWRIIETIRDELLQYDSRLGERPEIVAVSKAELPGADEVRDALAARIGAAGRQRRAARFSRHGSRAQPASADNRSGLGGSRAGSHMNSDKLIAVDIGNSLTKVGWFEEAAATAQSRPDSTARQEPRPPGRPCLNPGSSAAFSLASRCPRQSSPSFRPRRSGGGSRA